MVQLATEAPGQPIGHTSYVPRDAYIYDIDYRGGLALPTIAIADIAGEPIKDMGEALVCPVATGACVASTAGGVVAGYDMYGQYVKETIAAAGTGAIAFASIVEAPVDAVWVNQFGLPYKYEAAVAVPNADVLIAVPADDEDARGTFAFGGTFVDEDPPRFTEVEVPYIADRSLPFGKPYGARLAAGVVGSVDYTFVGTIDAAGLVTVTVPAAKGNEPVGVTLSFPDGITLRASLGDGAVAHTLAPVWVSQYGRNLDDAAANRLVAYALDAAEGKGGYVTLTGTLPGRSAAPAPTPAPTPDPPAPGASFATHAAADAWLTDYMSVTGESEPADWTTDTLSEKHATAQALYDHWIASH